MNTIQEIKESSVDNISPKIIIYYHGGCYDGFTSAYVANLFFKEYEKNKELIFIPAFYGKEYQFEICQNNEVYILDFSFDYQSTYYICQKSKQVTILDHHESAYKKLDNIQNDLINYPNRLITVFDNNRSGCGITWDYLWDKYARSLDKEISKRPWFINAMEDRDLWRFKLKGTKEIFAYTQSLEMTFENWDNINMLCIEDVIEKGDMILKYFSQILNNQLESGAKIRKYLGYKYAVVNLTKEFGSEGCSRLNKTHNLDFSLYFWIEKSGIINFGIRSSGEFRADLMAEYYKGGGHKQAAGFYMDNTYNYSTAKSTLLHESNIIIEQYLYTLGEKKCLKDI